ARLALERGQGAARRLIDLAQVDVAAAMLLGEARRVTPGALAEDQQIGERVSTQSIRAVQSGGTFAGGEQPRNRGGLRLRVDAHSAHDVVRGRTYLHRLLGDVDVRQLDELVVHAGQLLLDH